MKSPTKQEVVKTIHLSTPNTSSSTTKYFGAANNNSMIPSLTSSMNTPLRVRNRLNMRASLIQVPTPSANSAIGMKTFLHSHGLHSPNDIREAQKESADTSVLLPDDSFTDGLSLREISILASARKSSSTFPWLSSSPVKPLFPLHLNSQTSKELGERITSIFEEEKEILNCIQISKFSEKVTQQVPDGGKGDRREINSRSRMKKIAFEGFAEVMEKTTRTELWSLFDRYKHLSLFWITLARFEACHGHYADAVQCIQDGFDSIQKGNTHNHAKTELRHLQEALGQIQSRYGSIQSDRSRLNAMDDEAHDQNEEDCNSIANLDSTAENVEITESSMNNATRADLKQSSRGKVGNQCLRKRNKRLKQDDELSSSGSRRSPRLHEQIEK